MKEILENYHKISKEFCENKKVIDAKIEAKEEKIKELELKIERAKKAIKKCEDEIYDLRRPSTYDDLITPLAKKLSEYFGMPYELYGPFGLNCETSIYLREDMQKSICDQPTISLTLRPWNEGSMLRYDTGRRTNQYPKGSIGWLNNDNSIFAPLPMEFEEILKLVKHSDSTEETNE